MPVVLKKEKYERIVIFSQANYPLVPVESISSEIHRKNKRNYTFKQVYEDMRNAKFPTKEEIALEKEKHIKPSNGKFAYHNSVNMITAFNNSKGIHDRIYSELRTSDFNDWLKSSNKTPSSMAAMVKLYKNMDKYALQEDIIDKSYAQFITISRFRTGPGRTPFTYEQIQYLWDIKASNKKKEVVRDILLLAIYTGCRAEELFSLYIKNIYLAKNYFVGGLKTQNGTNREVPIHPLVKPVFEKYYNPKNEFLFTKENNKRLFYADYNNYYQEFIKEYPLLKGKTAHCGRHGLETELQRLNVRPQIINSILGHKNGDVGNDVYNHVTVAEKLEAIKLVTFKETKIYILKNQKKTS